MVTLTDLLAHTVEEVLQTPLLRQALVSYTKDLFYGGRLTRSCDSSCRLYYRKLQLEGANQLERLKNMKYYMKPGDTMVCNGEIFNASTLTDSIAEQKLKDFPKLLGKTIFIREEETAPAPAAAPAEAPKPKAARSAKKK